MAQKEVITEKVLWVCRENIGRSQVAEALWERNATKLTAASAGILVDQDGQLLEERDEAKLLIGVMEDEYGIDMRQRRRTSLETYSPEELGKAAIIMVLAEPSVIPTHLAEMPNVHHWEVPDLKDCDYPQTVSIIHQIETMVVDLQEATRDVRVDPTY